ncbi:MAG: AraC family transcriptional regulator [Bacteroidota bacterium]
MELSVISLVYLFGSLQGLVLLLGIHTDKSLRSPLKISLSLLLISFILVTVYYSVILNRATHIFPYVDSLGLAAWMAICPAYFLLCACLVYPNFQLKISHLGWFSISILFVLEGLLTSLGFPVWIYNLVHNPTLFLDIWMATFFGTSIYFLHRSLYALKERREEKNIRELIFFTYAMLGVLIVFALIFILIRNAYNFVFEYILVGLFELFIFAVLYKSFKALPFQVVFRVAPSRSYGLEEKELLELSKKLEKIMEEDQPYLNRELKLVNLSQLTGITEPILSYLFKQHYASGFYQFINSYRLAYAVQQLKSPINKKFTIAAIAEQSGFKNKATFYKVFKEKYQMTPAEFVKRHAISPSLVRKD